ncbi:MAG: PaaI family thioesterase [Actinomycetota bacterium]
MEEPVELPPHRVALSAAVNRLGHLLVDREIEPDAAAQLTETLEAIADGLASEPSQRLKQLVHPRNRIATFVKSGGGPDPPPSGAEIEFDPVSLVGGVLNPFTMGARYFRDGDEAVGRVTLGPCFEGPPERAHGGVICAVFDEVLGSVFRATGSPSAFTGELTVRFEKPAPLGVELEFRGRRVDTAGRRRFLEGEATGPDGVFATARAIFIDMAPEHLMPDEPTPEPPNA